MVYKIKIQDYHAQIQALNTAWITQHRIDNPKDTITQRYVEDFVWRGFGYVVKDAVTEQYITTFDEIVEELPKKWHEDKTFQIIQKKTGVLWGVMNEPDIASGLAKYRKVEGIDTYEEEDSYYFYVDFLLPEHKVIFDNYPQLEITVNEAD